MEIISNELSTYNQNGKKQVNQAKNVDYISAVRALIITNELLT